MKKVNWEKLAKELGNRNLELEARLEDLKSDKKRSEQLFCSKCGTAFKYDWHVEYDNCPKCGCDVAK